MRYDRDNVYARSVSGPATSVCKGLFFGGGVANFEIETLMLVYTYPQYRRQLQHYCTRRSLQKQRPRIIYVY